MLKNAGAISNKEKWKDQYIWNPMVFYARTSHSDWSPYMVTILILTLQNKYLNMKITSDELSCCSLYALEICSQSNQEFCIHFSSASRRRDYTFNHTTTKHLKTHIIKLGCFPNSIFGYWSPRRGTFLRSLPHRRRQLRWNINHFQLAVLHIIPWLLIELKPKSAYNKPS